MVKNYRLRDLMLSQEEMNLLNEVANQLGMKNTDVARLLLRQEITKIKASGMDNFYIAIVGDKKVKKKA